MSGDLPSRHTTEGLTDLYGPASPSPERRILIHAEQGFGDTLQFVRYIPAVAERGGRVVLEVPASLVRLARTVAGISEVVAAGDPLPAFDCHCPLLSLPRVFKTNLATIPKTVPVSHGPGGGVGWLGRPDPYLAPPQSGYRMGWHYGWRDRSAAAPTVVGSRRHKLVQSSGRRPVGRHLVSSRSKDRRPLAMAHGFCRNRGRGFSPGSGHQRGHFGCASGGRTRPTDLAPLARIRRNGDGCSSAKTAPGIRRRGCSARGTRGIGSAWRARSPRPLHKLPS